MSDESGEIEEADNKENAETDDLAGDFPELDDETLQILSDDEDSNKGDTLLLHPKLKNAWSKILLEGMKREKKTALLEKYPRSNSSLFQTPKLNLEIEASVKEATLKRDKFFVADLDLCGASLAALGSSISMIFNGSTQEIDTKDLLSKLIDSGKLMCELHNQLVKARKAFIYPCIDKSARQILEKTKHGEYLFGPELSQKVKCAKAVEKLGLTLKQATTEKKPSFNASTSLNWRGLPARGRGKAGNRRFQRNFGHYGPQGTRQPYRPLGNQPQQNTATAATSQARK